MKAGIVIATTIVLLHTATGDLMALEAFRLDFSALASSVSLPFAIAIIVFLCISRIDVSWQEAGGDQRLQEA